MNSFLTSLKDWLLKNSSGHVVTSPGYRNAVLVDYLNKVKQLQVHTQIDERSAAFFALGISKAIKKPTVLICTSGSAFGHYLPALMEAYHSEIPLIVLSADRPLELMYCGAPQVTEQLKPLASVCSVFDCDTSKNFKLQHFETLNTCLKQTRSSVQINCRIRKPFFSPQKSQVESDINAENYIATKIEKSYFSSGPLKTISIVKKETLPFTPTLAEKEFAQILAQSKNPLLVFGKLGLKKNWLGFLQESALPWVHDIHQQKNLYLYSSNTVTNETDLIIWIGGLPTTKENQNLLTQNYKKGVPIIQCFCSTMNSNIQNSFLETYQGDPFRMATERLKIKDQQLITLLVEQFGFQKSENSPGSKTSQHFWEGSYFEEYSNQLKHLTAPVHFFSNSLVCRDANKYFRPQYETKVFLNRGLNGIDGNIATIFGIAKGLEETAIPLVAFIGDVTFAHDIGTFINETFPPNLTLIVMDNSGGQIFNQVKSSGKNLNQHMGVESFNKTLLTPPTLNIEALAAMKDIKYYQQKDFKNFQKVLQSHSLIHAKFNPELSQNRRQEGQKISPKHKRKQSEKVSQKEHS